MRQSVPGDKYSIAWFKLAEYVSRGEKERALGIYKLLSHSMDDRALARQLEGDILWSFNDHSAAQSYHEAAQLYKESKRSLQAIALYEMLISTHHDSIQYLLPLFELYYASKNVTKIIVIGKRVLPLLLKTHDIEQVSKILIMIDPYEKMPYEMHQKVIEGSLALAHDYNAIKLHIQRVLDALLQVSDSTQLQQFLMWLESAQQHYYAFACTYLKR